MSGEIADLWIALRAETAPMVASFAEGGAAGEEMAASVTGAAAEVQAAWAEAVAACTAEIEGMVAAEAELTAATAATAEEVAASQAALAASYGAGATAAEIAASETTAAFAAMRDKIAADLAAVEAAEAECAVATEALGAKMSGSAASMGTASVAAGTFKASLSNTAGLIGLSSGQLLGLGAAAGVAAGAAVHMAADFETSTNRLVTSAGEDKANLDLVRDGILKMAGEVGNSAESLSAAMYKVESGGQHGAAGLKVLQAAAEGAKAEGADLTTVADALTSVLQDYHLKADDAAAVTSKMVAATAAGKMSFEEMSGALASVLPVASANHISLEDILGDMASMTVHGMSAAQVTQNLADVIQHMAAPTMVQAKELSTLGINAQQLSSDLGSKGLSGTLLEITSAIQSHMGPAGKVVVDLTNSLKGLPPAVQDLGRKVLDGSISLKEFTKSAKGLDPIAASQAKSFASLAGNMYQLGTQQQTGQQVMQSYTDALRRATGDATGLRTALMLTGENTETTEGAIRSISGATTEAGNHVRGWSEIQATFNQKASEAGHSLGALGISIGEKLLPVVTPLVGAFAAAATWISQNQVAATIAAVVIGGVLVVAFVALGVAAWTAAAGVIAATWPILAIIAVVALLAFGVYELISNWGAISGFFEGLWDDVKGAFDTAISWIGDRLGDIGTFFSQLPGKIGGALSSFGSFLLQKAKEGIDFFTKPFRDAWNTIHDFFAQGPRKIGEDLGHFAAMLVTKGVEAINGLNQGIANGYNAVVAWFRALPRKIADFFNGAQAWLLEKGREILLGARDGIVNAWNAVVAWFVALPDRIKAFLASAKSWLLEKGREILIGARDGIVNAWNDVVAWFVSLPDKIKAFFSDAGHWLWDAGKNLLQGLWDGAKSIVSGFTGWISDITGGFVDGFNDGLGNKSPSVKMFESGTNAIQGLINGAQAKAPDIASKVNEIANGVVDRFAGAAEWLIPGGRSLVEGLWNGVQQLAGWIWNQIVSWAGGLVNAALGALGVHSPSIHMVEAGRQMVIGLANGIADHAHIAADAAQSMATRVLSSAQLGSPGGLSIPVQRGASVLTGVGAGGGGGDVIHMHFNVAGSVLTEKGLVDVVQKGLLRHGVRNTGSGITYGFGTGR